LKVSSASFHSSMAWVRRMCSVGLCSYRARTRRTVSARFSETTEEMLDARLLGRLGPPLGRRGSRYAEGGADDLATRPFGCRRTLFVLASDGAYERLVDMRDGGRVPTISATAFGSDVTAGLTRKSCRHSEKKPIERPANDS
jgi:hypothetical protein